MAKPPWVVQIHREFEIPRDGLKHLSQSAKNKLRRMMLLHMDMNVVATRNNIASILQRENVPSTYLQMLKNRDDHTFAIAETRIRERTRAINELTGRFGFVSVSPENIDDEHRTIIIGEWSMKYEVNDQIVSWIITDIESGAEISLCDGNIGKALYELGLSKQKILKDNTELRKPEYTQDKPQRGEGSDDKIV